MMKPSGRNLCGALIVFREGMTKEEVADIIRRMANAGMLEHTPRINEFDPEWGYPTFYIP